LVIDADAVLPPPVTIEGFKPIAAKRAQVFQAVRCLKAIKPNLRLSCETRQLFDRLAVGEGQKTGLVRHLS
jgi:hypothetical protein